MTQTCIGSRCNMAPALGLLCTSRREMTHQNFATIFNSRNLEWSTITHCAQWQCTSVVNTQTKWLCFILGHGQQWCRGVGIYGVARAITLSKVRRPEWYSAVQAVPLFRHMLHCATPVLLTSHFLLNNVRWIVQFVLVSKLSYYFYHRSIAMLARSVDS